MRVELDELITLEGDFALAELMPSSAGLSQWWNRRLEVSTMVERPVCLPVSSAPDEDRLSSPA